MSPYFTASMLAAQLAGAPVGAALTHAASANAPADRMSSHVPPDWARPAFDPAAARATVRALVADESQARASAPTTYYGAARVDKYGTFAARFEEAAVPNCLGPNALKHQPPKIGPIGVGGILALPFLVVAAVRGKCN
jgi:hypothetical protein